jgi:hypothetical protein
MAMTQTAFRTRRALNRSRTTVASRAQRAEMPLFQAFLRPSSVKVTDGLCIKDTTMIDYSCGSGHKRISADPTEQRIRELEKENAELKHANEILQEALGFFAQRRKK